MVLLVIDWPRIKQRALAKQQQSTRTSRFLSFTALLCYLHRSVINWLLALSDTTRRWM